MSLHPETILSPFDISQIAKMFSTISFENLQYSPNVANFQLIYPDNCRCGPNCAYTVAITGPLSALIYLFSEDNAYNSCLKRKCCPHSVNVTKCNTFSGCRRKARSLNNYSLLKSQESCKEKG